MPTITDILNTAAPIATAIRALGGTIVRIIATSNPNVAILGIDLRRFSGAIAEIGETLGAEIALEGTDAVTIRKNDVEIRIVEASDHGNYLTSTVDPVAAVQLVSALGETKTVKAFIVEYDPSSYDDEDPTTHVHVVPADGTDPAVFTPAWLVTDEIRVTVKAAL